MKKILKKKAIAKKKIVAKKKTKFSTSTKAALGASVVAVGAGAYYFLGPKGKEHRGNAKVWMVEMEKDIEKKAGTIKKLSRPLYHEAVDALAKTYGKKYKAYTKEINAFAKNLKGEWKASSQR